MTKKLRHLVRKLVKCNLTIESLINEPKTMIEVKKGIQKSLVRHRYQITCSSYDRFQNSRLFLSVDFMSNDIYKKMSGHKDKQVDMDI